MNLNRCNLIEQSSEKLFANCSCMPKFLAKWFGRLYFWHILKNSKVLKLPYLFTTLIILYLVSYVKLKKSERKDLFFIFTLKWKSRFIGFPIFEIIFSDGNKERNYHLVHLRLRNYKILASNLTKIQKVILGQTQCTLQA